MPEDRRGAAESDEDGVGGDEKLFSAGKPMSARNAGKIATVSQHTRTISPVENHREE